SSGAIIQPIKDGGARIQGFYDAVEYSGPLNYLPIFWQVSVAMLIYLVFCKEKSLYFHFDFVWGGLFAMCFASALWASYSKVAFSLSVLLLLSYSLVNLHVVICGWQKVLESLHWFFICILMLSLVTVFLLPSYGISVGEHAGKWQGVFDHKNGLGNFAALIYVFYICWLTIERSIVKIVGIMLSLLLVIGSGSSTALINLSICTLLYGLLRMPLTKRLLFAKRFIIVGALGLIVISTMAISLDSSGFAIIDKDTSFSNRNLIWALFLKEIESAPWVGHGLSQFSAGLSVNERDILSNVGFVVGTAHNGFLECWHAIGVVGLALSLAAIVQLLRFKIDGHPSELAFLFLFYFVILNTFESRLIGFNFYFIVLMYVASLTKAMSQQHTLQAQV